MWWLLVSSVSKPVMFCFFIGLIPPSVLWGIVCHFLSLDIAVMTQISSQWPLHGCTPKARNAACLLLEAHKISVTVYSWEYFAVWIILLLPVLFVFVITGPLFCCCSVVCLALPCDCNEALTPSGFLRCLRGNSPQCVVESPGCWFLLCVQSCRNGNPERPICRSDG